MKSFPWIWVLNAGLLIIVIATALPLLRVEGDLFRWLYSAGALLAIIGKILAPGPGKDAPLRQRRLSHIGAWACVAFCVAAFFMWYEPLQNRDWLAFTIAGGVLLCYSTFMAGRVSPADSDEKRKK